jgi:flagellar protein FliT
MMTGEEVISLYETVADITDQMLTAARKGDWDLLASLESRCTNQVKILKLEDNPVTPVAGALRERKIRIIQKILADDREIRNITESWMAQLSILMNSSSTERKLSKAYGARQLG